MPTTYTFAQRTGRKGRPKHHSFSSLPAAALALGVALHVVAQLRSGVSKRSRQGWGFVSAVKTSRATNASCHQRGSGPLPVTLQHLETGRTVSAPSIAAFCRKAKVKGVNARYHLTPVLQGHRLSYKGWGVPAVLNAELPLKDVFGNETTATVAQWTKTLSITSLNRLRAGQPAGAIAPLTHDFGPILGLKPYRVKAYRFRKADGSRGRPEIVGETLAECAAKLGISTAGAYTLAHGLSPRVKGATFIRAETEARRLVPEVGVAV